MIIQVSKLVNGIKMSDIVANNHNNNLLSSDSETKDRKVSKQDKNRDIGITAPFNKIMEYIKNFYDICIENKHISIIKHKLMTLIIWNLKEMYANVWKSYKPSFILKHKYIGLLFNEYI